jgi:hypothetical protein
MIINFWVLVPVVFAAGGLTYIITGSAAGYIFRFLWWAIFRRTPFGPLFFCPSCMGTWVGFLGGYVLGLHWIHCLQTAFATCLFMAIAQQQWGIAAADEDTIEAKLKRGKHA